IRCQKIQWQEHLRQYNQCLGIQLLPPPGQVQFARHKLWGSEALQFASCDLEVGLSVAVLLMLAVGLRWRYV
ncbi:hypothetical protein HaLaN_16786, partial [Haematococcus lacustris]